MSNSHLTNILYIMHNMVTSQSRSDPIITYVTGSPIWYFTLVSCISGAIYKASIQNCDDCYREDLFMKQHSVLQIIRHIMNTYSILNFIHRDNLIEVK